MTSVLEVDPIDWLEQQHPVDADGAEPDDYPHTVRGAAQADALPHRSEVP
ncbi:hypothetical protein ACE11G_02115 [Gordonia sp. PS3]|nr:MULTISPECIES: hypothetical protein [Gordonia]